MTPTDIAKVRQSFALLTGPAEKDAFATLFYARLFKEAPFLRPLFPNEMGELRQKLMATLTLVVRELTNLEELGPKVEALGKRHVGYGAKPEHYALVGAALIWALQEALGDQWCQETRDGWVAAYTLLSGVMIAAAESVAVPAGA